MWSGDLIPEPRLRAAVLSCTPALTGSATKWALANTGAVICVLRRTISVAPREIPGRNWPSVAVFPHDSNVARYGMTVRKVFATAAPTAAKPPSIWPRLRHLVSRQPRELDSRIGGAKKLKMLAFRHQSRPRANFCTGTNQEQTLGLKLTCHPHRSVDVAAALGASRARAVATVEPVSSFPRVFGLPCLRIASRFPLLPSAYRYSHCSSMRAVPIALGPVPPIPAFRPDTSLGLPR